MSRDEFKDPVDTDQGGRMMPFDPIDSVHSISEDNIRLRAYSIYQERGGTHGSAQDDWFKAETQLAQEKLMSSLGHGQARKDSVRTR